jgi:hypothetical protein
MERLNIPPKCVGSMTPHETEFERHLEIFRELEEAGAQFFHAYLAIHEMAARHKETYDFLCRAPLFWNTVLRALQEATFFALGRIFDQGSLHNLDRLVEIAQGHTPEIFSRAALRRRKQGCDPKPPPWLEDFLRDTYEPTPKDLRRMRGQINSWRRIYERNYRDLRNRVFAHSSVSDPAEAATLFKKTDRGELQGMFAFLGSLHDALWELFFNGREPTLRPLRDSVAQRVRSEAQRVVLSGLGQAGARR